MAVFGFIGVAASTNVSDAVESTWTAARTQIEAVVDNVVFPVLTLILAVLFFVKLGTAYFDYRKQGQFEFVAPAILFFCLVFTITAPLYIWTII
ncbi:MAG: DUF3852 domain-containing protein [Oscillospiraceae bacterium]|nr:DUF3852 domain-containing protein [Oscillospiraceae bacterium]